MVVPLWDLEAGQYSLSVAVSIYLSTFIAEENLLSYSYPSLLIPAGGDAGDGQGAGASSGDGAGGRGGGGGGGEGRDRDEEGVGQGKRVGGREQVAQVRKDTAGGAREGGSRARGGGGRGSQACGGDEHAHAIQEWREKQRGEKREQDRQPIGGLEEEEERWGQGWNCAAVGRGEMGGGGSAQRLDTAMANVLWASTQASFTLE